MWPPSMRIWQRHNPCLPIDCMWLFMLWQGDQSWDTMQPSGIWRSRKHGKVKDSEEKCYLNYLGAGGRGEECISREAQTAWAPKSFVAGPSPYASSFLLSIALQLQGLLFLPDGQPRWWAKAMSAHSLAPLGWHSPVTIRSLQTRPSLSHTAPHCR